MSVILDCAKYYIQCEWCPTNDRSTMPTVSIVTASACAVLMTAGGVGTGAVVEYLPGHPFLLGASVVVMTAGMIGTGCALLFPAITRRGSTGPAERAPITHV
jgi:hypothetical protein